MSYLLFHHLEAHYPQSIKLNDTKKPRENASVIFRFSRTCKEVFEGLWDKLSTELSTICRQRPRRLTSIQGDVAKRRPPLPQSQLNETALVDDCVGEAADTVSSAPRGRNGNDTPPTGKRQSCRFSKKATTAPPITAQRNCVGRQLRRRGRRHRFVRASRTSVEAIHRQCPALCRAIAATLPLLSSARARTKRERHAPTDQPTMCRPRSRQIH